MKLFGIVVESGLLSAPGVNWKELSVFVAYFLRSLVDNGVHLEAADPYSYPMGC